MTAQGTGKCITSYHEKRGNSPIIFLFIRNVFKRNISASLVFSEVIEPARIYGSTSRVTAGQDFELKCSTYGLTKAEEQVFVYLCKNGVGLDRVATKSHDITFTVKSASLDHTGNYSCVFSRSKYSPNKVRGEGDTPVFIKVIGKCLIS